MSQYEKPLLAILSGTKGKNLLFSDLRLMLERVDFQCRSQETACVKYEIILYWSEDNHTYIIEVLEQRVVRNAREEIRVQALTHKLTQNRNFPCGNSGTDSIEEYSLSERTTSNRAKRDQFHSSDKLRTRRPGVRIPQGVPSFVDKRDADKNPALWCGIFAYKIKVPLKNENKRKLLEKPGCAK